MKQDRIADALNDLDDALIEETMKLRYGKTADRTAREASGGGSGGRTAGAGKLYKMKRLRYIGIAACLCLAVSAGAYLRTEQGVLGGEKDASSLPLLTVMDKIGAAAGGGFTSVLDDRGNPWDPDKELKTLPAFKNSGFYPHGGPADGLTEAEMEEKLRKAADAVGVKMTEIERNYEDSSYDGSPFEKRMKKYDGLMSLMMHSENITISVERDGAISINSKYSEENEYFIQKLPDEYFSEDGTATDEQADKILDYLAEKYEGILNLSNVKKISYIDPYSDKDPSAEEEPYRHYILYDGGDSYEDELVNYTFGKADFSIDDGMLTDIYIRDRRECIEKLGDYPVISQEEALQLLLDGQYRCFGEQIEIDEDDVEKVELLYIDGTESDLIPYYEFYVNYPYDGLAEGEKHYMLCLVPAIELKYISDWSEENLESIGSAM